MARFLVATHPITGHVLPGIPMVAELVRRGSEVAVAGPEVRLPPI